MPTDLEYLQIALAMEEVLHHVDNPDSFYENLLVSLGRLDSQINDPRSTIEAGDPLWIWWLKFNIFEFARSTNNKSIQG